MYQVNTVYGTCTGLFLLNVIFALHYLQTLSSRFEFAQTKFCFKERFFKTLEFAQS